MLFDGPYFQATDEGELVFLMSDGDASRRPTEHEILEPEEEDSTLHQNYYLRIPLAHADSQRWREEIAKYLAPLILGGTYNLARSLTHPAQKKSHGFLSLTGIFPHSRFQLHLPCGPKRVRGCDHAAYMM